MHNQENLLWELARLQDREHECQRLISMIDDGVQDLDMTTGHAELTSTAFRVFADIIQARIQEINQFIEFENNQTMTRFANREIT